MACVWHVYVGVCVFGIEKLYALNTVQLFDNEHRS